MSHDCVKSRNCSAAFSFLMIPKHMVFIWGTLFFWFVCGGGGEEGGVCPLMVLETKGTLEH